MDRSALSGGKICAKRWTDLRQAVDRSTPDDEQVSNGCVKWTDLRQTVDGSAPEGTQASAGCLRQDG